MSVTGTSEGQASAKSAKRPHAGQIALSVAALGVVYGDIGTSPLYALNLLFFHHREATPSPEAIYGGISLVIWALTIVVAIKYAFLVLRADNDGEGGVFALYSLLDRFNRRGKSIISGMLLLGAGLLFGDGVITPAISVLSATEGIAVATPVLSKAVIPATLLLLTVLFAVQHRGTREVGRVFGPIMILWFVVIAALGVMRILPHPEILKAFNPAYGVAFLAHADPYASLIALGAVMLVVTGGEAMYADMGHIGARPIRTSWFALVYPALILNYLGQGAFLLAGRAHLGESVFFGMAPRGLLYPVVALATVAAIIASQALISGTFSLTAQAVALGFFPPLKITHTHQSQAGAVYAPFINWSLYLGCVALVISFGSSDALGAAYGLAESGMMITTSLAMVLVSRHFWNWSRLRALAVFGALAAVDVGFLVANSVKFMEGGYVPLSIGLLIFLVMTTWSWGRRATQAAFRARRTMPMAELIDLHRTSQRFIDRTAILMVPPRATVRRNAERTPTLLQLMWTRNGLLPRHLIFVQVVHPRVPYVHEDRFEITEFERNARGSIIRVELRFGFMEWPDVEAALKSLASHEQIGLPMDEHRWIVHVANEHLLPAADMGHLTRLRLKLFETLRLMSQPMYYHYGLGDDVQLSVEILPVRVRSGRL